MKKIAAIFLSSVSIANVCCISPTEAIESPNEATESVSVDNETYADGIYTGSSYGYYKEGAKRYPIKVDVTISDGMITNISKHQEGDGYEYPDDSAFAEDSEKIIEILGTGSPKSILEKISRFEAKAQEGQNAVEGTEFDAVTGATKSALGLAGAVKDALNISKVAAKNLVKKELRILYPDVKTKSMWLGEQFDLSKLRVEVTYSDESKEEISYSDFAKKGLKMQILLDDRDDFKVSSTLLDLNVANKAYDIYIKDKDNDNIKDSFRLVAKNRFYMANNLFYKIGDGEFKEATFEEHHSPNGQMYKDFIIDISDEDYGKILEMKTTRFYDYSDDSNLDEEYLYEKVKIKAKENQVFLESRGIRNSEDNIYVYPKKFDSSAIRVVFRETNKNVSPKEALESIIEKYQASDSDKINELIAIAREAIESDNLILEEISNLENEKVNLEGDLGALENIKIDYLEGREPNKPDKYSNIENSQQASEKIDEIYDSIYEIEDKINDFRKKIKSEDELNEIRLNIIKEMNNTDVYSDENEKEKYISMLRKSTDNFKENFSHLSNLDDESLEKNLYIEKVKKAEKILEKNKEELSLDEYKDVLKQLERASDKLKDYRKDNSLNKFIEDNSLNNYIYSVGSSSKHRNIKLSRISGNDRYESSAVLSKNTYQKSETVILVNGESEVDALLATPLSRAFNAPILLVKKNEVPASVKKEIERLNSKNVILIGGSDKISDSLVKDMKNMKVSRISGKDRLDTSRLIAEKIYSITKNDKKAILVNKNKIIDAISTSNLGINGICPILLTDNNNSYNNIYKVIKEKDIKDITIIGGRNSIDSGLEDYLKGMVRVRRFAGEDRYETAMILAKNNSSKTNIIIASGKKPIDSLIIPMYAINKNASVILTRGGKVEKNIKSYITDSKPESISIVGGNESISLSFEKELNDI